MAGDIYAPIRGIPPVSRDGITYLVIGRFSLTYSKRYAIEDLSASSGGLVRIETDGGMRVLMVREGFEIHDDGSGLEVRSSEYSRAI